MINISKHYSIAFSGSKEWMTIGRHSMMKPGRDARGMEYMINISKHYSTAFSASKEWMTIGRHSMMKPSRDARGME
jgi:hypothetical protein